MSVILNNYFGRQFNSLNDVAIHPKNKEMYFTDVTYGWLQDFRPAPILPNQVYRFNYNTGLVGVVADGFDKPNGMFMAAPLLIDRHHLFARRHVRVYCRHGCSERAERHQLYPASYHVSFLSGPG
jgi:hypothetical protein